jgi:hypothetical protein
MRAALVLIIGMVFWLTTPAISEAHKVKQHDNNGYSQHQDNRWGHNVGYQKHDRHQQKAWKKHRKEHRRAKKHWRKHDRYQRPVKVVYRDRWSYPLFPRIVINLPL